MTKLIGITGKARAGKDTFATALIERGYYRVAFADTLKKVTALIAGEHLGLYHDDVSKELMSEALGMTRRRAMQNVGNGLRDALGPDVWHRRTLRNWRQNGGGPTVITDVRYDNEAQGVIDAGGVIVEIVRPGNVGLMGEAAAHVSERGINPNLVKIQIINDGTIELLRKQAFMLARAVDEGAV